MEIVFFIKPDYFILSLNITTYEVKHWFALKVFITKF